MTSFINKRWYCICYCLSKKSRAYFRPLTLAFVIFSPKVAFVRLLTTLFFVLRCPSLVRYKTKQFFILFPMQPFAPNKRADCR